MKKLNWLAIILWLAVGGYGIFYNLTYIDEAKYLIKGWLMASGKIGYYSTPEFFYQHMPGGLLWFGLGQKLFGPNLLIARVQSWILGLMILWFSVKLVKAIRPQAQNWILPLMVLAPVVTLYYSSAVPQSLAALTLVLAFYFLFKNKFAWATVWFTLSFVVRENFLFTLFFYLVFLFFYRRQVWLKNFLLTALILAIFFIPGWPGILNVFKNFPGVSSLLPVTADEKEILALNFQQQSHSLSLYLQAVKEFIEIYWAFGAVFIYSLFWKKTNGRRFKFLIFIAGFNFLAHAWSAFNLSPRSIVPYFAYTFPLLAVITAVYLAPKKISWRWLAILMALAQTSVIFASLFQPPTKLNTISTLNRSAANLRPLIADKNHVVWLGEPMSLYLAGRVSYYPLINLTNFFKPSDKTETIRKLGFWNQAMMTEWLKTADFAAIDSNRRSFADLGNEWHQEPKPEQIWPPEMTFYSKSLITR